ncbi:MAG: permease, partial [Butyrivibrio sp.]|nr:permease [Butyrivibrio sp.]
MLTFLQEQIIGMKWLNSLIGDLLGLFGIDTETKIGASALFFIYDTIKITLLLCVLIFIISFIQSFFPPERSRKIISRFRGIGA